MLLSMKYVTERRSGTVKRYGKKNADARLLPHHQSKVKAKGFCIASF